MRRSLLVIALLAGSAGAQSTITFIPGYDFFATGMMQTASNNLANYWAIERVREANAKKSGEVYRPTPVDGGPDLAFIASPERRRANYARFLERSRAVDPAGAAGLAETLKLDPVAMATPELAKAGLSPDNVADAYAVYWVEAWQAAHGRSGATSRVTAQAVRDQAAAAMEETGTFDDATDAQKQEFADALLVQAVLVGAAKEQAGDPARLATLGAAVERGARAMGLDLRAVRLTEQGFVATPAP